MDAGRTRQGFTLVEFVMMLAILGFLIGGALKGEDMMANARVTRVENDYRAIAAAIQAYQDRYDVLPGDDPAAATRFPGIWSAADNGNGDGVIEGAWNSSRNTDESRLVWKHLHGAGLLKGPSDATPSSYRQPTHAFGGAVGVAQRLYNLEGPVIVFGALPGDAGRRIEEHGDDGDPSSGAIQGNARRQAYDGASRYDLAFRF